MMGSMPLLNILLHKKMPVGDPYLAYLSVEFIYVLLKKKYVPFK